MTFTARQLGHSPVRCFPSSRLKEPRNRGAVCPSDGLTGVARYGGYLYSTNTGSLPAGKPYRQQARPVFAVYDQAGARTVILVAVSAAKIPRTRSLSSAAQQVLGGKKGQRKPSGHMWN